MVIQRRVAALGLTLLLGACAGFGEDGGTYMPTAKNAVQPVPETYRTDILAFMTTYINDLHSVHDAAISTPQLHTIGGRERYVVCVRYTASGQGDMPGGGGDRAAVFLDGRMERLIEKGRELCEGATYTPFPEMEKLKR
jgi:hypothetical protein